MQQRIYSVIAERGKITKEDLITIVSLRPEELEQQFALLRHCELVRAFKEGDKVYLTKW
jgi:hypothetical protein